MYFTHTIGAGNYTKGGFWMESIMKENTAHLAIASIPKQKWNEIYNEEEAFGNGTIFPELNKPFYVTEDDPELKEKANKFQNRLTAQESMLLQIQQTGFVLDDLRLYMDTHPEDLQGLKMLKVMVKVKKNLMREFAVKFYPLTPECMADIYEENPDSACYCWPEGKIPWEGAWQ